MKHEAKRETASNLYLLVLFTGKRGPSLSYGFSGSKSRFRKPPRNDNRCDLGFESGYNARSDNERRIKLARKTFSDANPKQGTSDPTWRTMFEDLFSLELHCV